LAAHFGRGVRDLIEEHSARLDLRVRRDARASHRFLTDKGGEYFATGIHGAVTGRRADLAVIDDPVRSLADVACAAAREHVWDWFRTEVVTRMKPRGRIVVAMTRWHDDDLAGRLLDRPDWTVLRLPALAEIGDPLGRAEGSALWPEWEDRAALLGKQELLGARNFSALFQQTPLRKEGMLFAAKDLHVVDIVPVGTAVRAWDLAATAAGKGNPDWTAGVKLVRDNNGLFFVDDVVRFRGTPADVESAIRSAAERDGTDVVVGLPRDPGQAGLAQIEYLTRALAGYRVVSSPETGSKIVRAQEAAAQTENGRLRIRRAGWTPGFIDELSNFPDYEKDDQVDALSRAFMMLQRSSPPAHFARFLHSSR
jgi:predicted phage terminase large subunit-like protein